MAKCDVCGKTSLLPEKFGKVNVCKICFMKANGPFWKRQYDRHEDAEKHRSKALEAAHKQSFPQPVVSAINDYFVAQMDSMLVCDCCGMPVQHRQPLGNANICKECYKKINTSAWKESDYPNNNEVEENRKKILKIASKHNYPAIVIDGINKHFDSHIQVGLIDTIYGERQKLKVFETHSILDTYESFDDEEMSKRYAKLLKTSKQGGLTSNNIAKAVVQGVLGGGIVTTGISLAKSTLIDAAANAVTPAQASFHMRKGQITLDYALYDMVEFQKVTKIGAEDELGYIKFQSSQKAGNEAIFFFTNNYTAEKMYSYICNKIDVSKNTQLKTQTMPQEIQPSTADELLKFKQLLDMGAITQEEFDAKKKQLLGL